MAFTIAHMAAALPFYRSQRWINFAALLIGTMLPDLPYFLHHSSIISHQSHQWSGIISYCLPWGLLVFALWHWWLRSAALALVQPWYNYHRQQVSQPVTYNNRTDNTLTAQLMSKLNFALKVIAGLTIGAATHLIWDGTTHPDGFIAEKIALLQQVVTLPLLGQMAIARLLQYLSSIAGLLLLLYFVYSRYKAQRTGSFTPNSNTISQRYHPSQSLLLSKSYSVIVISLIGIGWLIFGLQAANKWHTLISTDHYTFLAKTLVSSVQGAVGVFIVYALIYKLVSTVRAELLRPNS